MSDVTDINALIEEAAQYVLANSRRGNASLNSEQFDADTEKLLECYRDIIAKALQSPALRTLAERQPVGEPIPWPEKAHTCPDCNGAGGDGHGHTCWTCAGSGGVIAVPEIQAAEQRGADRAFEEAAGIAGAYNNWDYVEIGSPGAIAEWKPGSPYDRGQQNAAKAIEAAIRQRIGGQ